ncbi:hypothetical protein B0T17DRAFT_196173 [Bombardia bombarda]|uniref:Uncharacterized protein n=1 Tax=Bombardia bombarda TaxID=252184 RepID=A0AA39X9D3_9PEZI|nr:hypothetical protein B0T17DRAFT_196173 [Bombardia bombarda]
MTKIGNLPKVVCLWVWVGYLQLCCCCMTWLSLSLPGLLPPLSFTSTVQGLSARASFSSVPSSSQPERTCRGYVSVHLYDRRDGRVQTPSRLSRQTQRWCTTLLVGAKRDLRWMWFDGTENHTYTTARAWPLLCICSSRTKCETINANADAGFPRERSKVEVH